MYRQYDIDINRIKIQGLIPQRDCEILHIWAETAAEAIEKAKDRLLLQHESFMIADLSEQDIAAVFSVITRFTFDISSALKIHGVKKKDKTTDHKLVNGKDKSNRISIYADNIDAAVIRIHNYLNKAPWGRYYDIDKITAQLIVDKEDTNIDEVMQKRRAEIRVSLEARMPSEHEIKLRYRELLVKYQEILDNFVKYQEYGHLIKQLCGKLHCKPDEIVERVTILQNKIESIQCLIEGKNS